MYVVKPWRVGRREACLDVAHEDGNESHPPNILLIVSLLFEATSVLASTLYSIPNYIHSPPQQLRLHPVPPTLNGEPFLFLRFCLYLDPPPPPPPMTGVSTADAGDGLGAWRVRLPRVFSWRLAGGIVQAVRGGVGALLSGPSDVRLRGDGAHETVRPSRVRDQHLTGVVVGAVL